jgi:hypothetical protein
MTRASSRRKAAAAPRRRPASRSKARVRSPGAATRAAVAPATTAELASLREEVKRGGPGLGRWNADPEDVQRSVARLVLSLVEFLRKLMERQAVRRMEAGTLDADQIEAMGVALMRLEETLHDLAGRFGIAPEDLNLDLGPLGRLM